MASIARGVIPDLTKAFAALPHTLIRDPNADLRSIRLKLSAGYKSLLRRIIYMLTTRDISYMPKVRSKTYDVATDASTTMGGIANMSKTNPVRRSVLFSGPIWI
jgi:hypothetical protein